MATHEIAEESGVSGMWGLSGVFPRMSHGLSASVSARRTTQAGVIQRRGGMPCQNHVTIYKAILKSAVIHKLLKLPHIEHLP